MAARPPTPDSASTEAAAARALTRERIAKTALELADRHGAEGLTMRHLAAELGVGTMTLYGYFRSKDELMDAAVDVAAEEIKLPPQEGDWKTQLRALMAELYRVLRRHPSGVRIRADRPLISAGVLRSTNYGMAILRDAGFGKAEAAGAWRLLFVYLFGFVAFTPTDVSPDVVREWGARMSALPRDEFASLLEALPEALATMSGSDPFYAGLDVIIAGLESRLGSDAG